MTGGSAGLHLPATDSRVDVSRIELQPAATPASALGSDYAGPAAEKAVEHDVAAGRAVEYRVGHHRHRLHGRVQRQKIALAAVSGKRVDPRVMPHIGSVAPELAELDIVAMPIATVFEDEDQLVLAAL